MVVAKLRDQAPTFLTNVPGCFGCPLPSPLAYIHSELSHLLSVFHVGKLRPVPLKRRLALGKSSWYPKETLVSCILVLASNSTPTCSWRDQGNRVSFPDWTPGHTNPWQPMPGSVPLQPVSGPAHLVTGFVVVCRMHARLAQRYCCQPVVHCKRRGSGGRLPRGFGNPGPPPSDPGVRVPAPTPTPRPQAHMCISQLET